MMKYIKKFSLFAVLLITIFSFSKIKNTTKTNLKIELNYTSSDVLEFLSLQQFECRPSSKFKFYVDTEVLKKSRGFCLIEAKIYMKANKSDKPNLLATEKIIVPFQKDMVFAYDEVPCTKGKSLENGDKLLIDNPKFSELLDYSIIYESYIISRNKLVTEKV